METNHILTLLCHFFIGEESFVHVAGVYKTTTGAWTAHCVPSIAGISSDILTAGIPTSVRRERVCVKVSSY